MPAASLPDRALIQVSGADAEHFLHNLVTTDIAALPPGEAWPGALLTPQGKILFDFLIARDGDGFVLDTTASQREALIKRLSMYKLRAAVEIVALDPEGVTVAGRMRTKPISWITDSPCRRPGHAQTGRRTG
jgi:folate-binding Fe-S cluster repair protein YgfZ